MLCGVAALGLETSGSGYLVLARIVVLGCCSVGFNWIGTTVLDFGGRFLVELVGVGPEVLTGG